MKLTQQLKQSLGMISQPGCAPMITLRSVTVKLGPTISNNWHMSTVSVDHVKIKRRQNDVPVMYENDTVDGGFLPDLLVTNLRMFNI